MCCLMLHFVFCLAFNFWPCARQAFDMNFMIGIPPVCWLAALAPLTCDYDFCAEHALLCMRNHCNNNMWVLQHKCSAKSKKQQEANSWQQQTASDALHYCPRTCVWIFAFRLSLRHAQISGAIRLAFVAFNWNMIFALVLFVGVQFMVWLKGLAVKF